MFIPHFVLIIAKLKAVHVARVEKDLREKTSSFDMDLYTTRRAMCALFVLTESTNIQDQITYKGWFSAMDSYTIMAAANHRSRHVRVHHVDKGKDNPLLMEVLSQRPEGAGDVVV